MADSSSEAELQQEIAGLKRDLVRLTLLAVIEEGAAGRPQLAPDIIAALETGAQSAVEGRTRESSDRYAAAMGKLETAATEFWEMLGELHGKLSELSIRSGDTRTVLDAVIAAGQQHAVKQADQATTLEGRANALKERLDGIDLKVGKIETSAASAEAALANMNRVFAAMAAELERVKKLVPSTAGPPPEGPPKEEPQPPVTAPEHKGDKPGGGPTGTDEKEPPAGQKPEGETPKRRFAWSLPRFGRQWPKGPWAIALGFAIAIAVAAAVYFGRPGPDKKEDPRIARVEAQLVQRTNKVAAANSQLTAMMDAFLNFASASDNAPENGPAIERAHETVKAVKTAFEDAESGRVNFCNTLERNTGQANLDRIRSLRARFERLGATDAFTLVGQQTSGPTPTIWSRLKAETRVDLEEAGLSLTAYEQALRSVDGRC